jgi:hypothetical protein
MRGFVTAEQGHTVLALPPQDINGGKNSDVWSHRTAPHGSILVALGAGGQTQVTLHACDDFTPSNAEAIPFAVYRCDVNGGDVLGARVELPAAGFQTSANDNVFYVVEYDAADLPEGKKNLQVRLSNPGVATMAAVTVLLSGLRYAHVSTPTVLA